MGRLQHGVGLAHAGCVAEEYLEATALLVIACICARICRDGPQDVYKRQAPDDASLQPLAGAFAAGAVVGSDDNILLPVWGALRQSVASLLEGATAAQAEDQLRSLLAEGADASS